VLWQELLAVKVLPVRAGVGQQH